MCRTQLDPLRLRPLDPRTIPPWLHPTKFDFLKKKQKNKKQNKTKTKRVKPKRRIKQNV